MHVPAFSWLPNKHIFMQGYFIFYADSVSMTPKGNVLQQWNTSQHCSNTDNIKTLKVFCDVQVAAMGASSSVRCISNITTVKIIFINIIYFYLSKA